MGGHGNDVRARTVEFWGRLNPDRTLSVPPDVAAQLQAAGEVKVVVIVPGTADDRGWAELTTEQFRDGYDPGGALYDDVPPG